MMRLLHVLKKGVTMGIIYCMVLLFMMFSDALISVSGIESILSYWDEIGMFLILGIAVAQMLRNPILHFGKEQKEITLCFLGILTMGIIGNFVFGYIDSIGAVVRDIVQFMKFPVTYLAINYCKLNERMAKHVKRGFIRVMAVIVFAAFALSLISLVKDIGMSQNEIRYGVKPFMFVFSHPTYLVHAMLFVLFIVSASDYPKKKMPLELMLAVVVILTMRTKGIAFIAVYFFIRYTKGWMRRYKILYWALALVIVVASAASKLVLYASWASSPREVLYKGSLQLLVDCFPFGSGFATFASHISWNENSLVYNFIKIPFYYENGELQTAVVGDSGFPYYIAQFGLIGCILSVRLFWIIYKQSIRGAVKKIPVLALWMYMMIALTSESILQNNGLEFAVILSVVSALVKKTYVPRKGIKNEIRN